MINIDLGSGSGIFIVGALCSLVATLIWAFVLVVFRPRVKIFPAVIENEKAGDSNLYLNILVYGYRFIILHFLSKIGFWRREKAIDVKVIGSMWGNLDGNNGRYFYTGTETKNKFIIPLPLYESQVPIFEYIRTGNDFNFGFITIPIELSSRKLWRDLRNQLNPGNSEAYKIIKRISLIESSLGPKSIINVFPKYKPFIELLASIFVTEHPDLKTEFFRIFPNFYAIKIEVNFQDEFSGLRKTVAEFLTESFKLDLTRPGINWHREANRLLKRRRRR